MDAMVNVWGVLLAAISMFVIGGLWYGLLFARPWQRAAGVSDEQLGRGALVVFGGSFVLSLVAATSLAFLVGSAGLLFGTIAGLVTGATLVTALLGVVYLFERRPVRHFAINAGYAIVAFTAMGAIVGALQAG
jgi:uncharacterized SAM-binding protein YcdF (DUF218 family)